jgi:ABC-type nitrate/sulfonate/bicarbonate transport system ATPase subunit
LFDVAPSPRSESNWSITLPLEDQPWQIGLVVGASGSGKTTLAREAWPAAPFVSANVGYDWPADRAVVDGFPAELSIKDVTAALSSVGFSSPPAWLRPFRCLSTGEQFRATVARALCDPAPLVVIDEFTSVVDRTVAQIGSAAVAKAVRRTQGKQVVCVTCHYDVEEWLCPDWVVEMPTGNFARRSLQRPPIELEVARVHSSAWALFKPHHYMSAEHHKSAYCFCGFVQRRPVAFCSVLHFPHPIRPGWKEHRTVVLPDFQGVGLGNLLSEFVASLFKATGKPYRDTTGHPAHVRHRLKSPLWKATRGMSRMRPGTTSGPITRTSHVKRTHATDRLTMSFEYVGPARPEEARRFGLIK